MKKRTFDLAENAGDLAELPIGTAIVTRTQKIMELDEIEAGRRDSGNRYWIAPGTLTPVTTPPDYWFPAIILKKKPVPAEN